MSCDSRTDPPESQGFPKSCLVEGDAEQRLRERHVRRRALGVSIVLQSTVLGVLVLTPLLAKPGRIALGVVPVPPYYGHREARSAPERAQPRTPQTIHNVSRIYAPPTIPPTIPTREDTSTSEQGMDQFAIPGIGPEGPGLIPLESSRSGARPPQPPEVPAERPVIVHRTQLDPAMLIHRVEPVYPALPKQLGRSGRVDLHAIIATDGTIQSLQVVGGDPLFYQSALEAVRQWRYTPTTLNGRPVEVDTYIYVIYTIQR